MPKTKIARPPVAPYMRTDNEARSETLPAALYCRLARADDERIARQEEKLRRYAAENGCGRFTAYRDNGASGVTLDRPGLGALLESIRSGKVKQVIVADMSRLARGFLPVCELMKVFSEHGVTLTAVSGGGAMNDENPFAGLIGGLARKHAG